ncbi:MAG: NAD(P)H-dependent oxidoreductase subunit E [Bacillota bacterium]|nr:NAD(P)H-dependent oxidoreductase subunit E [Bacillota bacterium]
MKHLSCETIKEIQHLAEDYKKSNERLMEVLLEMQRLTNNCFDKETLEVVSNALGLPESKLYDYITFYARFSTERRGKYIIRMCKSAPCHVCGAKDVATAICDFLEIDPGGTTDDGIFTVEFCECIGLCESSPSVMINDKPYSNLTPDSIKSILKDYKQGVIE